MKVMLENLNLMEAEKKLCEVAMEVAGDTKAAAKLLGINRHTLGRRLKRHGLPSPQERRDARRAANAPNGESQGS